MPHTGKASDLAQRPKSSKPTDRPQKHGKDGGDADVWDVADTILKPGNDEDDEDERADADVESPTDAIKA